MDGQCFAKFEANTVEPSLKVPHGIKYSLTLHTLHDKTGQRVALRPHGAVKKYRFQGHGKLLVDFWAEVVKFTGIEE